MVFWSLQSSKHWGDLCKAAGTYAHAGRGHTCTCRAGAHMHMQGGGTHAHAGRGGDACSSSVHTPINTTFAILATSDSNCSPRTAGVSQRSQLLYWSSQRGARGGNLLTEDPRVARPRDNLIDGNHAPDTGQPEAKQGRNASPGSSFPWNPADGTQPPTGSSPRDPASNGIQPTGSSRQLCAEMHECILGV